MKRSHSTEAPSSKRQKSSPVAKTSIAILRVSSDVFIDGTIIKRAGESIYPLEQKMIEFISRHYTEDFYDDDDDDETADTIFQDIADLVEILFSRAGSKDNFLLDDAEQVEKIRTILCLKDSSMELHVGPWKRVSRKDYCLLTRQEQVVTHIYEPDDDE